MRDPKRIERVLKLLQLVWPQHSDLRLGQLMFWLANNDDLFYLEDDELIIRLQRLI